MKPAWAIVWHGKGCVVFMTEEGGWSLDPCEARVFEYWAHARVAGGFGKGVEIVRCWV